MAIKDRILKAPIPFETAFGMEAVSETPFKKGNIYNLLVGTAGCSPYLRGQIHKEKDWLEDIWDQCPSTVFQNILKFVDTSDLAKSLRQAKRRVALLTALCDLGGIWQLEDVTKYLTEFADFATHITLKHFVQIDINRGKLPNEAAIHADDCAGIFVIAMGKMGAFELNYSSDIDLICFFDDAKYKLEDITDVRACFIRIIQRMTKMLSDVTSDGYVFRTDLRLRPNPSVTPVCISTTAALRYYETEGRTWERAAYIKARCCAGDTKSGDHFLQNLTPFIWRRQLDFAAIEDAHDMRKRIRSHKGFRKGIELPGHNLKLGRGGIREIEFFAQTRQMIAGGRDDYLRDKGTVPALLALAERDWITTDHAKYLCEAYRAHRTHEHRIQMIGDVQTHDLPNTPDEMDRLARFCGFENTALLENEIKERLDKVDEIIEDFFAPDHSDEPDHTDYEKAYQDWEALPAFRSPRALTIFQRLKPKITKGISFAVSPDEALTLFETFLRGLPSGVQVFSLFDANPKILNLVLDIVVTAPSLATYLSRNAGVLDAVLSGAFFEPLPNKEKLIAELEALLAENDDYENQLNIIRRWLKDYHFRVGVLQLRNIADAIEASVAYSELAQACLVCLLPHVQQEFERKHGQISGSGLAILAMGKLGSNEMTASSDLDLIIIYDPAGQEGSNGKRPLATVQYYARLTQALLTAITSPTSEGKLYDVDMRLRPSGRSGPVATSVSGFLDYQKNKAWIWEHLALSRSSVVSGSINVIKQVEDIRRNIICSEHDREEVMAEVKAMRDRLAKSKSKGKSIWDVKEVPGGLLDIELLAQAFALTCNIIENHPVEQLRLASKNREISSDEGSHLIETHQLLSQIQHVSRLLVSGSFNVDMLGETSLAHLLTATGYCDKKTLQSALMSKTADAEAIIMKYLDGIKN